MIFLFQDVCSARIEYIYVVHATFSELGHPESISCNKFAIEERFVAHRVRRYMHTCERAKYIYIYYKEVGMDII